MSPRPDVTDHTARVLIVDDEPRNRQLLEVMLSSEGLLFSTATNGEEALARVAEEPPDLVLLDVMMPGMDGYEVAEKLKSDSVTRNIPIIMVTALDDRDARMRGLTAGAEDFISKPVDRAELRVRVRNLLRLKAYGDYFDKYSRLLEGEVGSRTAEARESELLYRSTFDAAPVGIGHVDLDGAWLKVNQRLCEFLGYSCEELQSIPPYDPTTSDDSAGEAKTLRQMAAGTLDHHVTDEKKFTRRDGSVVWGRVNMSVHRDAAGKPRHFISVIEDITERRTLEAQVRQATKMDAIGRLASGVAHDFNNLLTVILGFAELIIQDPEVAKTHSEELGEIVKAAQRASNLTKQLLAFSRQQVLHSESLDVNGLITDMGGMLGRLIGENIGVTLVLAPDLPPALADRSQLEQVVMNLVVNARDAMPDGGSLTIETKDVLLEDSAFREQAVVPGWYVVLAITDTGTGMTPDVERRLFEPFFTTKEAGKGTGLGLSTTYGIVKQSKGYIWVSSKPGQGTTFHVYLPRSNAAVQANVSTASATEQARTAQTVLLVEDEAGVRRLTRRILDSAGYRVLEAENGDHAEEVFGQNSGSIDLIVTDMVMPGCGGPELLSRLHAHTPGLRVVYMTGYTDQSSVSRTGIGRGLPFVQKPFTAAEFLQQVREALDQ